MSLTLKFAGTPANKTNNTKKVSIASFYARLIEVSNSNITYDGMRVKKKDK